jgi:gliding motility-associated-like protein
MLFLIKKYCFILLCICLYAQSMAQQISFQKIISPSLGIGDVQCFDGRQTKDGGYIFTGIGKFGGSISRPVLVKLNCHGTSIWAKNFGISSTVGNVFMRVIETSDGGYTMLNSIGTYGAYNMLVVHTDKNGNTLWRKVINNNAGDDIGQCIKQTNDNGYIIVGATNSYGTEAIGSSYKDAYAVKLDASGNTIWSTTVGNNAAIDEATAVVQTQDGGFAITGRYIATGAFYAMLLKLNSSGAVQYLKTFGDTLHSNYGIDIAEASNKDLVICGSSTLMQNSFQDYADHFVVRCNELGDTIWTKVFQGANPNSFENASSIFIENDGTIVIGANTASYPTTGFVPNKQMVLKLNNNGNLLQAVLFNNGSSHYARCAQAFDAGYVISGFTTKYSVATFKTNFIKTPTNILDVCNTIDVTANTITANPTCKVVNPTYTTNTGCANITSIIEAQFTMTDSSICEFYPNVTAAFTASNSCANSPVTFTSTTPNSVGYVWYFGNGDSAISSSPTVTYTYTTVGTFTVTLIVSNGCDLDTATQIIQVGNPPILFITQTPDPAKEGEIITLNTNVNASNYMWNTGSGSSSITVTQAGLYYVTAIVNGCLVSDTIQVAIQPIGYTGTVYIPNILTPNNDGNNDYLEIFTKGGYKLKSIMIYNRFGNRVYQSTDIIANKWYGSYKGQTVNDVYYYYAVFVIGTKEEIRTGDIIVVR